MWQEQKSGSRLVRNKDLRHLTEGKVWDSKAIEKSLFVMAAKGAAKYCGFKPCWLADREPRGNGEMPVSLLISFDEYFYRLTRTSLDWVSCCSSSLTRAWKNAAWDKFQIEEWTCITYVWRQSVSTNSHTFRNKQERGYLWSVHLTPAFLPTYRQIFADVIAYIFAH